MNIRVAVRISLLAAIALSPAQPAPAQHLFPDERVLLEFQRAADSYAFVHRQMERRLGLAHRAAGEPMAPIESAELASAIRAERPRSLPGEFFTPGVTSAVRARLMTAVRRGCDAGELQSGISPVLRVYEPATSTHAVPDCIATALPQLPVELAFRSVEGALVLVDPHAGLVLDVLPRPITATTLDR